MFNTNDNLVDIINFYCNNNDSNTVENFNKYINYLKLKENGIHKIIDSIKPNNCLNINKTLIVLIKEFYNDNHFDLINNFFYNCLFNFKYEEKLVQILLVKFKDISLKILQLNKNENLNEKYNNFFNNMKKDFQKNQYNLKIIYIFLYLLNIFYTYLINLEFDFLINTDDIIIFWTNIVNFLSNFDITNINELDIYFYIKSLKYINKLITALIQMFEFEYDNKIINFILSENMVIFYINIVKLKNNWNSDYMKIFIKYFNFFLTIKNLVWNKKIQIEENNTFILFLDKLKNFVIDNLLNLINDNNFDLITESKILSESKYYNYINDSLGFFINLSDNNEFIKDIKDNWFLNLILNVFVILINNENELLGDQKDKFIKKHIKLLDNIKVINKNKLFYKILKIVFIITQCDTGLDFIFNTLKYGIISIFNFNKKIVNEYELINFYNNTKQCKWYKLENNIKLELYISILIYINNHINNKTDKLEFLEIFINHHKDSIISNGSVSLQMKFIYFIIIYQNKFQYNFKLENENKYINYVFKIIDINNNFTLNSFILTLLFKIYKNSNDMYGVQEYIFNYFVFFSKQIIEFIDVNYNSLYYDFINKIFISNINKFDLNNNYNNLGIFDNITNMIINKVNIILNSKNISKNNILNKLFFSLIDLCESEVYVNLFNDILKKFITQNLNYLWINQEWVEYFIDFIIYYIKNCNDNNKNLDIFLFLFSNNNSINDIIKLLTIFIESKSFPINNDIFELIEKFICNYLISFNYSDKNNPNKIKNLIYLFIKITYNYKKYINNNFIDIIISFIYNYTNFLNKNMDWDYELFWKSFLNKKFDVSIYFILIILYFKVNFKNNKLLKIIEEIKLFELINHILNMKNIDFKINRFIIICLILILNNNYNELDNYLMSSTYQFITINLMINYYRFELKETIECKTKSIKHIQSHLINEINFLYNDPDYSYHLISIDKMDIINRYTLDDSFNIPTDILNDNNEYSLYKRFYLNHKDKLEELIISKQVKDYHWKIINIENYYCESCKINKNRIIYY